MELFYRQWNASEDLPLPRLLLLHGMGGTGALWRPLAASLENEMAILAPDQRGHGKSLSSSEYDRAIPAGSGYSPLDYGQDVLELQQALGWHPTWILGHSMGVRTAVATAHLRPEWVQGLILIDLGFSGPAGGGLGDDLAQFLKQLPTEFTSRAEAKAFMTAYCPDPSIAQYLMAASVLNPSGAITFPFDHSALIQTIEAARTSSLGHWIAELAAPSMPILVLRGAQSLVWSHEDFELEKNFFSNLPSIQFVEVEGAGHGLPFEKRLVLVDLIRKLTAGHTLRA